MGAWVGRHWIGVLTWITCISWLFHIYLLAGAVTRDDIPARNWELVTILIHHILMLGLFVVAYRRRKHDGSV